MSVPIEVHPVMAAYHFIVVFMLFLILVAILSRD